MSPLTDRLPKGPLRWLLRLPIWLYRLNLGWLLGQRFLLLTHTGRVSGLIHKTVIEVVDHDKETGTYTVASGWGEKADWYRNILKTPDVTIQVGRKQSKARAVPLTVTEGQEKLFAYAQKHPGAFRELSYLMMGERLDADREEILKMAGKIPLIALQPQD
jgi:deazaflavin-dependent oxidoreductase (nitroreductase family)